MASLYSEPTLTNVRAYLRARAIYESECGDAELCRWYSHGEMAANFAVLAPTCQECKRPTRRGKGQNVEYTEGESVVKRFVCDRCLNDAYDAAYGNYMR